MANWKLFIVNRRKYPEQIVYLPKTTLAVPKALSLTLESRSVTLRHTKHLPYKYDLLHNEA